MGMSSSQARLLSLTSRMHDIEYKAQKLEAQKLQMANESAHVYQKYEDALNKTKIQGMTIGADGSAAFIDASLLVLEGNAGDENLAGTIFLKNTYNDKIYISRTNADKFKLPEDGNVGTEIEFMDRLGIEENVLGYNIVTNENPIDSYSTVDTVKGTQTTREVPVLDPNWGYQPTASAPLPANGIAVSTVSTFDPNETYVIKSKEDLIALQTLTNNGVSTKGVHFVLGADLDMSGVSWQGIGVTEAHAFQGIFDGNGHTISNLSGTGGLFGFVTGNATATTDDNSGITVNGDYGIVSNVILQNVNINGAGKTQTGALINKNKNGYVDNCYTSGTVSGMQWAGGLIGFNERGIITSSTSNVNVNSTGTCVGGFVGHDTGGMIQHSISTGDVNATQRTIGGFIGHENPGGNSFIFECATTSNVSGGYNKGIFFGQVDGGSTAKVIGCEYVASSGIPDVGSGAGNMTSNGNDPSLTAGQTHTVTTTNITMPSKTSIKSNIMMAIDKSGAIVPSNFETTLDNWLNQFYKEDTRYSNGVLIADALKLASINDYITEYLKTGNNEGVVDSVINDVNRGTTTNSTAYQKNYEQTVDFEYTGYYSNDATQAKKTTTVEIGTAENIANNLYTILKGAGNQLETSQDVAKVQNWVKSKFNTSTEAGKKALAEFNNYITSNPAPAELTKIMNAINSNGSYTPPAGTSIYTDTNTTYNFVLSNQSQTANIGWDRTNPAVDEALNFYEMVKGGYIIVEDEQASSTEWLSNMVNSGTAIFSQIDRTTNKGFDTNVATNVLLQEVSDETELKKAEAEYEADMRKIDSKDKRYDVELAHLENERNAIKTEIDTLKTVAKDNVDRTFKLFG